MVIVTLLLTLLLLTAAVTDMVRFVIPNWLVLLVMLLYPVMLWLSPQPVDWKAALIVFGIVFVAGFAIFSFGWAGGGDVKLFMACSLWVGRAAMVDFLVSMAIIGGVMTMALIVLRRAMLWAQVLGKRKIKLPALLQVGQPVPYGLAICGSMLWLIWGTHRIAGLHVFEPLLP